MPVLLFLIVFIAVIVLSPFATIGAVNTLFGKEIPFTFWTWLSAAWLTMIVAGKFSGKSGKD